MPRLHRGLLFFLYFEIDIAGPGIRSRSLPPAIAARFARNAPMSNAINSHSSEWAAVLRAPCACCISSETTCETRLSASAVLNPVSEETSFARYARSSAGKTERPLRSEPHAGDANSGTKRQHYQRKSGRHESAGDHAGPGDSRSLDLDLHEALRHFIYRSRVHRGGHHLNSSSLGY